MRRHGVCRGQGGPGCVAGGGWEGAGEGYQATPARLRSWAFFCKLCEAKMRFEEGHEVTGAMRGMLAWAED